MNERVYLWIGRAFVAAAIITFGWATLGAVAFAMPWSTAAGLACLAILASWSVFPKWPRRAFAVALPILTILFVLQIAAPEYMEASDEIGCEVRGLVGKQTARCVGYEPRLDATQTGPVLTTRQQYAVRWLNVTMAIGGTLLGFEDVAYETLLLMKQANSTHRDQLVRQPVLDRLPLCDQRHGVPAATVEAEGTIALESSATRRVVANLSRDLGDGESIVAPFRLGNYASPDQTWATTLALWVPTSTMRVTRQGDRLETVWSGTILYPATSEISVTLPRPIGRPYRFALDEALFCAAQLDGVFVPYEMRWRAEIAVDDPILGRAGVDANAPGLVEGLIRPASNTLGFRHRSRVPRGAPAEVDEQLDSR